MAPFLLWADREDAALHSFSTEVEDWLPVLPEIWPPRLAGELLFYLVKRKCATAGSLDGWCWRR